MQLKHFDRDHGAESESEPYHWIDRNWGAGREAHRRVWVERDVEGYEMERWTVRREQFDDSGQGQLKPSNLSTHSSKEDARSAAVDWMRNH